MSTRLVLLLLRRGWGRKVWSPIDDGACGLGNDTRYNVAHSLTWDLASCCCFISLSPTTHNSCDISVLAQLALLICLTSLRGYVGGQRVARIVG
jgi:hypothetical protein